MATETEKLILLIEGQNKDLLKKLEQVERKANSSFRAAAKTTKQFDSAMAVAASSAKSLLMVFGAGAAFAGLASLPGILRDTVAEASQIGKIADRIGIGTEALQELRFAAELSGASANELDAALQQFSKRTGEAAAGTGDLLKILEANNVALRDSEGNVRPLPDLLRQYADLVKNAATEQERLYLIDRGFGRGGLAITNLLDDGAAAFTKAADEARRFGNVLDDDLIRSMEDIDDRFARLTRTIGYGLKTALLEVVDAAFAVADAMNNIQPPTPVAGQKNIATEALRRGLRGGIDEGFAASMSARGVSVSSDPVFRLTDLPGGAEAVRKALAEKRTVVPSSGKSEAERQAEAVARVVEQLQREQQALSMTATEQRIMNELHSAGAGATEMQRQQITQLVTEIESARSAQEGFNQVAQFAGTQITGIFSDLISGAGRFEDSLARVASSIADAALQATLLGQGPLASLFGLQPKSGGAGGILGALFSGFRGFFAGGGQLGAGQWGIAGERGPEVVRGPAAITPMGSGGGPMAVNVSVDLRGANGDATIQRIVNRAVSDGVAQAVAISQRNFAGNFTRLQTRGVI